MFLKFDRRLAEALVGDLREHITGEVIFEAAIR